MRPMTCWRIMVYKDNNLSINTVIIRINLEMCFLPLRTLKSITCSHLGDQYAKGSPIEIIKLKECFDRVMYF